MAAASKTRSDWPSRHPDDVVSDLKTDGSNGLSEAEAARRLSRYGPNRLFNAKRSSYLDLFREEVFENPLVLFLIAVGVLYAVWGSIGQAVAIFVIIFILGAVEVSNEVRSKRAIQSLRELSAPLAQVVREGEPRRIKAEGLVPGDVVILASGDRVPADLRLLESASLSVDESALTGESAAIEKDATATVSAEASLGDRANMLFAGTSITRGRGRGVAVATGLRTEVGWVGRLAEQAKEPRTPLQIAMGRLAKALAIVAVAISFVVPAVGLLLGQPLREMVLSGLTLAFATVPEELPILITMVLAIGAYRLSREGAIVKRLRAAETVGSVDVLLVDKTGTLTENHMRVSGLLPAADVQEDQLLSLAAAATDVVEMPDGLRGDAMDVALVEAAKGRDIKLLPVVRLMPFDQSKRAMAAVVSGGVFVAKGAPEAVLRASEPRYEGDLDSAREWAEERAALGERVVAVAGKPWEEGQGDDPLPQGLELIGLVAFSDPPKPSTAHAVDALRRAGVDVIMVTGDHPRTAKSIAAELDIPSGKVLTGRDLEGMDDVELRTHLDNTSVFARVTPADKLRITQAAQAIGRVVAVTGDGVNDAAALRAANAGIAMGGHGTDVAREAADIVLTRGDASSIVSAVREGRLIFRNLSSAVRYYLAAKVALVLASFVPVLLGQPIPFTPLQIIIMELFMDLGASAAFVTERAEGDLMERRPRDSRRPFLDRQMVALIFGGGVLLGGAVLCAYFWAVAGGDLAHARTVAFASWLVAHVALAVGLRGSQAWNSALAVWGAAAVILAVLVGVVGWLQDWLQAVNLDWTDSAVIVLASAAALGLSLGLRRVVIRYGD